ncbi:MAG: [FeFe] hydrogenase H-cluster radical SAM maturase HydG, partial [Rikenellaceae bacterium]|nr:[FeFe] hydrogenase H-cluster radical SAM maturase HydG [Rikenellaceae bacterium]
AEECRGLDHRQALLLLECDDDDLNRRLFSIARNIKQRFYGNRIVMFAPLYLSNYCVNGCVYCPFHLSNTSIPRRRLSQDDIRREVTALQDMGHKRLAIETGEDPVMSGMDYLLESIETIYSVKHRNGSIRRVNVNIAATTTDNYRRLKEAGIGTYILFQETYNRLTYEQLHPSGPKSDYCYHTEAMDRAMEGGIDDVGIGVLFGLDTYRYDLAGLLMHTEHLEARFGVGPHTVSIPRICPADDIDPADYDNAVPDSTLRKIAAIIRVALPYTGMIVSTRESQASREALLEVGVTQLSGGSRTGVGGYAEAGGDDGSEQFDISDRRPLDQVVSWLLDNGHIPSFCTSCYRRGRTGDRFMSLVKSSKIAECCAPNAIMTLKEYLCDYASPMTKDKGDRAIKELVDAIESPHIKKMVAESIARIERGERDLGV